MIEVKNLVKRYGGFIAVNHISFDAHPGEIVGLLGPNGAGKTTTMRILTGYMPPTSGEVKVAGFDVLNDSMAARQRVGYLPERVPLYPDMSVEAYVLYWARLRRTPNARQRTQQVLEQFNLLDRRKKLVRSLSKGLRQRLGLAQAIVHDPPVLILDEPTIGIDPKQVVEVREVIRNLKTQRTILFSSHILSEVEQLCDRVVILDKGRVVGAGTREILSQQLQAEVKFYVAVNADVEHVHQLLLELPGVINVSSEGPGFVITAADETIRQHIMSAITINQLDLLELRPIDTRLEDIFMQRVES